VRQGEWVEMEGENGDFDILASPFGGFKMVLQRERDLESSFFLHLCHVFALNHSSSLSIALH
jgi:hypothetical protein